MNATHRLVLSLYGALIAIWPIRHLVISWIVRRLDFLTPESPRFCSPTFPLVSAIIPAKDEEATLARCLGSVCTQAYPHLEILVINDRSTDGTAAIAADFARADPRVRVITIDELPAGWTGKTYALQTAADQA
jgi:chlorobactene glucosyltransferase